MAGNITTLSSTIASGCIRASKLAQRCLGPDRRVDDRLPGRRDVGLDLIDRAHVEMRQVALDEVLPVAVRVARRVGGRQVVFLETVVGEHAGKAAVADEDRPGAAVAQRLGDADAVEGRAEGSFGEERDRRRAVDLQHILVKPGGGSCPEGAESRDLPPAGAGCPKASDAPSEDRRPPHTGGPPGCPECRGVPESTGAGERR